MKRLLCFLGFHRYERLLVCQTETRTVYEQACSRCGHVARRTEVDIVYRKGPA